MKGKNMTSQRKADTTNTQIITAKGSNALHPNFEWKSTFPAQPADKAMEYPVHLYIFQDEAIYLSATGTDVTCRVFSHPANETYQDELLAFLKDIGAIDDTSAIVKKDGRWVYRESRGHGIVRHPRRAKATPRNRATL